MSDVSACPTHAAMIPDSHALGMMMYACAGSAAGAFGFGNAPAATPAASAPAPMASAMSVQMPAASSAPSAPLLFPGLSLGEHSMPFPITHIWKNTVLQLVDLLSICSGMLPAGSTTPAGSPAASPPAFGVSAASQPADALAAGEPWPPLKVLSSGASITTHADHSRGMWPSMIKYVAVDGAERIMCSGADALPQRGHLLSCNMM